MISNISFLQDFAEFIISKFGKDNLYKELKIILPNSRSCIELKELLTGNYNIKNLPIIIPFNAIISKKDSSEDYMSKMEELFTLSKIITEYKKLDFTPEEALKTAGILNKLFADLVNNNIDIKLIETYNNSEYWQNIYKFLEYSFLKWQKNEKQSSNNYKLKLLLEEIARTKNSSKKVILAGIFKPDSFLKKYEEELQIIKYNEIKLAHNNIYYYKPTDIYEEAEQIAHICKLNADKKIAIVTNNDKLKRIYCNYLDKYELVFEDLIGNDLKLTNVSSLLISIINILCNNFDLKLLFLLLKNPLINCTNVQKLELLLSGKNRFISSPKYLLQLQFDNEDLRSYCHNLVDILFATKPYNINDILVVSKEIAEKLLPEIWEKEEGAELLEFLNNLIEFSDSINTSKKDFPKIFTLLLSSIKYYKNIESKIVIGSSEELALSRFNLIILPHFNSDNWSTTTTTHPYLSKEAKQILNIDYDEITPKLYSDYFDLLLQNEEVIILNAKKYAGKLSTPCNLFLKLQNVTQNKSVIPRLDRGIFESIFLDPVDKPRDDNRKKAAHSTFFPNILSVTDIETLIRNPYGFYAKKILKLRTQDKIWEEPKISDFGNFIHKVLEEYSKNYDQQNMLDKQQALLNIGNNILHSTILPTYTKKTWQTKLTLLSKAFILFDMERRKNCQKIYFEIKGELNLNIAGQNIKIIGIADRIEISKSNRITILDYKTGTIPTKKEIELGLSPQLIIESLMILENGFNILSHSHESGNSIEDITIAYVKITRTKPYVQTTEISLSMETLDKHKQGLIRLLEYYVTNKSFVYDLDMSKYNDYLHLRGH
ncbi:PD-(D/E)XK nuclease family protein [Rickettsia endosymbiont of Lasioglossum villosulum]|uniref:PD-(D/E)XK nuclease family protein n=1 Tax=Rickettsia endosymbiont of Lasioglossum villosulum TaxID=3066269 RepID=UPI00313315EC